MRRPHLLEIDGPAAAFAPLVEAARALGFRVGWLELEGATEPPAALAEAASLGVLRAVSVGAIGSVAVKPRSGPPVLDDLLREHFLGCALVLVRGDAGAPRLAADGEAWAVARGAELRRLTTAELARALGRPRPFGGS